MDAKVPSSSVSTPLPWTQPSLAMIISELINVDLENTSEIILLEDAQ